MLHARRRLFRHATTASSAFRGGVFRASSSYFHGRKGHSHFFDAPKLLPTKIEAGSRQCAPDNTGTVTHELEFQYRNTDLSKVILHAGETDLAVVQGGRDGLIGQSSRWSSSSASAWKTGHTRFNFGFAAGPVQQDARCLHSSTHLQSPNEGGSAERDRPAAKNGVSETESLYTMSSGWTLKELNWPNAISLARLLSGPYLAVLIFQNQYAGAFLGLAVAAASDWLDGFVARRQGIESVLGSYLDPLADKILVGCVGLAMAVKGLLPAYLVVLMLTRDLGLVAGAFLARAYQLQWKWSGWADFFRVSPGGAIKMEPLFLSKVNTVAQLVLVAAALGQPAIGVPDSVHLVSSLSAVVSTTTILSGAQYAYINGLRGNTSVVVGVSNVTKKGQPPSNIGGGV